MATDRGLSHASHPVLYSTPCTDHCLETRITGRNHLSCPGTGIKPICIYPQLQYEPFCLDEPWGHYAYYCALCGGGRFVHYELAIQENAG